MGISSFYIPVSGDAMPSIAQLLDSVGFEVRIGDTTNLDRVGEVVRATYENVPIVLEDINNLTISISAVPIPGSGLLLFGGAMVALTRRKLGRSKT